MVTMYLAFTRVPLTRTHVDILYFSLCVVNRWNALDTETVTTPSVSARLGKSRAAHTMGFFGLCR